MPARALAGTGGSGHPAPRTEYVLMRVAGDPEGRVLVYDRHEWECFLDGVRGGEFDERRRASRAVGRRRRHSRVITECHPARRFAYPELNLRVSAEMVQ